MEQLKSLLKQKDQQQLLRFYDELSKEQQTQLTDQIKAIDFSMVEEAMKPSEFSKSVIEPIKTMTIAQIMPQKQTYFEAGKEALSQGKVAAVVLAGGQGTRLGFDGPKGTLNIGITHPVYLFELLLENTRRNLEGTGTYMHFYVMTSVINDKDTRDFFEKHDYFGYPKQYVHFFTQDMSPALDLSGKILLHSQSSLSLAPNGNGGWFRSLERAGMVEEMIQNGIEWLNVVSVDNVLQSIADPVFIGATLLTKAPCAAKVIAKATPEERVGAICLRNGRPSVVEYSELSDEMRYAKNEEGEYLYNFGVTLNYLFNVKETQKRDKEHMPIHRALKKIEYMDENGDLIKPEKPNAYKLEYFIFDILEFFDSVLSFECVREDEFAPIKNAEGTDSVASARELLVRKTHITL